MSLESQSDGSSIPATPGSINSLVRPPSQLSADQYILGPYPENVFQVSFKKSTGRVLFF